MAERGRRSVDWLLHRIAHRPTRAAGAQEADGSEAAQQAYARAEALEPAS